MTANHIDQLAEWWENAERSDDFYPGDTWIKRTQAQTGGYVYDVGRVASKKRYYEARVLARAPKPKPAWHDAVAVLANHRDYPDEPRTVWSRDGDPEGYDWNDHACAMAAPHHLVNVTPLIEAKVTDEMVECAAMIQYAQSRAPEPATRAQMWEWATESERMDYRALARQILTAALGLDVD